MKKEALFVFFIFIVLTGLVFFQAEIEDESLKVNDAYACLQDKVDGKCSTLSLEEKIFAFWAGGKCQSELLSESDNNKCWPDGDCEIKTTAQAILALDNYAGTTTAKDWLSSQNTTSTDILWYLEIESPEPTTCTIDYYGTSHTINIAEDKTINTNAGSCLVQAQDDYWLRVSPTCFGEEFEISCNQKFLTTLLFRKAGSSTVHVSSESSSASADGVTTEKVNSLCFEENNQCVYEGSLWAALALKSSNEDVSAYLPYLMTLAEDNPRFIPDAFLYFITGDVQYKVSLLTKQKSNSWWLESGDKYFDTALALYPFYTEEGIDEKTNAKEWLLEVQEESGCWDSNNVKNTAFILASIWPKESSNGNGLPSCKNAGFFCMPSGICEGEIFADYNCQGSYSCCSAPQTQTTCSEQSGEKCSSNQVCNGNPISAGDLSAGQICCIGSCGPSTQLSDCELNNGFCRFGECESNEKSTFYACGSSSETCCIDKGKSGGAFWIWFFLILIVLVVVGIIFRDKLRNVWFKISSGKSKPGPRPRPGPRPPPRPMHRQPIPERRILLPAPERPRRRGPSRAERELDTVLTKLKKMNK